MEILLCSVSLTTLHDGIEEMTWRSGHTESCNKVQQLASQATALLVAKIVCFLLH